MEVETLCKRSSMWSSLASESIMESLQLLKEAGAELKKES